MTDAPSTETPAARDYRGTVFLPVYPELPDGALRRMMDVVEEGHDLG